MKSNAKTQYTIRNIPRSVDQALRKRAKEKRMSLNSVLLEACEKAAGLGPGAAIHDDLDALIGSWIEDPATEAALKSQRTVDPKDWKKA